MWPKVASLIQAMFSTVLLWPKVVLLIQAMFSPILVWPCGDSSPAANMDDVAKALQCVRVHVALRFCRGAIAADEPLLLVCEVGRHVAGMGGDLGSKGGRGMGRERGERAGVRESGEGGD